LIRSVREIIHALFSDPGHKCQFLSISKMPDHLSVALDVKLKSKLSIPGKGRNTTALTNRLPGYQIPSFDAGLFTYF